ncbi:hypothetical protein [Rufibacter latericius]|uniref:Uncharacterized protein n=1 Tax=Rufibacter latericius TaxID=2487040 RepID=A0A3M9MAR5_9BACT|nr:hypothetical protein [Rufibacter latericius]RNI22662.1 hypothetical protein EFB08_21450 [Rufibacter latericius]
MKDRYEQLMMQEEAAMGTQVSEWMLPAITERTRRLLTDGGVAHTMHSGGIRLQDKLYELDAMACLTSAVEEVAGDVGFWKVLGVYRAVFA